MEIALIYNPNDYKLRANSYSQSYRHMFLALVQKFESENIPVQHIIEDTHADEIHADVILFYDIHSNYHIQIKGLYKHPAIKYEYFDDPHQLESSGYYQDGTPVHKLGPEKRCQRALKRGVQFIISPYYDAYLRFLAPHLNRQAEAMLIHFPISPDSQLFTQRYTPLAARKQSVLANGATVSNGSLYDFRKWAFCHPQVDFVPHYLRDPKAIKGEQYPDGVLAQYAGLLALADWQAVPKYFEGPLAGCVTFMQWNSDAYRAGFRDHENCIFVEKSNFNEIIDYFLKHIIDYQSIAQKGRELVEHHYTAQHFADFIYNHMKLAVT